MDDQRYYTLTGYSRQQRAGISKTMEDYLEMICRCAQRGDSVRVNQLAALLNVTPPSASKMATKLKKSGMVEFEPYGVIRPSERGAQLGEYLLRRHDLLHRFFCLINHSKDELELVEKIEHFIDEATIENIEKFLIDASLTD